MNQTSSRFVVALFCAVAAFVFGFESGCLASSLTHRYSFNENANDSVGAAHATLESGVVISNGTAFLSGTGGVRLPANVIANSLSLTLEVWFAYTNSSGTVLWSFPGSRLIQYVVGFGPGEFVARGFYGTTAAASTVDSVGISREKTHHLVWSQNFASRTARLYVDGVLFGQNTNFTAVPGTNSAFSFLGRSHQGGAGMRVAIEEFRIHSNALSHLEVLMSQAAGPDALPVSTGELTNLLLRTPSHVRLNSKMRPLVFAKFDGQSRVNLTELTDIAFASNDTNVLQVADDGYVNATGLGTADLVASYAGFSATSAVTVIDAGQFGLKHRYDFRGRLGLTNLPDIAGGGAGAHLVNSPRFTNTTHLFFDGANDYVDLPDGILSTNSEITVESWVVVHNINSKFWPRIFDFGSWGSYFFLTPSAARDNLTTNQQLMRFAVATNGIHSESPRLTRNPWIVNGCEAHLAVTYSPNQNVSRLYVNGVLADSGVARTPLSAIVDTNNWLARSQFTGDGYFNGLFDEFRIYDRALEPAEVAASFLLGPNLIGADYVMHARSDGTNLMLSWGSSASWCRLEAATDLAENAEWTEAGVSPVFNNGRIEAAIPLSGSTRFFRLNPQ